MKLFSRGSTAAQHIAQKLRGHGLARALTRETPAMSNQVKQASPRSADGGLEAESPDWTGRQFVGKPKRRSPPTDLASRATIAARNKRGVVPRQRLYQGEAIRLQNSQMAAQDVAAGAINVNVIGVRQAPNERDAVRSVSCPYKSPSQPGALRARRQ